MKIDNKNGYTVETRRSRVLVTEEMKKRIEDHNITVYWSDNKSRHWTYDFMVDSYYWFVVEEVCMDDNVIKGYVI